MTRAQAIPYLPVDPLSSSPGIGLVGCGNISRRHLAAYKAAGYNVVSLCDLVLEQARVRRDQYYPGAGVTDDYHQLLKRDDIEVVDIAVHVEARPAIVRDALMAGKHVLSQKPFVLDLSEGERLARLAEERGRILAVNQNGRWAPHHAYLLSAAKAGLLGEISSADFALYWPHDEDVRDHPVFATMEDLILYDFGIHWFDLVAQLFVRSEPATAVYAALGRTPEQYIPVPTSAQVTITYPNASATLLLRGSAHRARSGSYRVDGSAGSVLHSGDDELGGPTVVVSTDTGSETVRLQGDWWGNGMHGAMAELLVAIEEGRAPSNEARASLPGLALCFAAMTSARTGLPVDPRVVTGSPR